MTAIEWDLDDLEEIPFEGGGLVPVVPNVYVNTHTHTGAGSPTVKKCRCCDLPTYAPRAVYCSPKSTCRSRYHRNPTRYQQQNATGVASVASLTPDTIRQIIREEIAGLSGGGSRPTTTTRTTTKPTYDDSDLLDSMEIRKDETAGARSVQNFLNLLYATQSGKGGFFGQAGA